MVTPVWTELVCMTCSTRAPEGRFAFNGRIELKVLKDSATKFGWVFKHDECFCSDICRIQYEQQQ